MNPDYGDVHFQIVDEWLTTNSIGLSLDQQVFLLEKGIHSVEQRALKTLSNIGLMVILDRVLHQSTEKFDLLCDVKIINGINIDAILNSEITKNTKDTQNIIIGLRYFLIELLRVLGRLTAEILTKPLHTELKNVTFESKDNK